MVSVVSIPLADNHGCKTRSRYQIGNKQMSAKPIAGRVIVRVPENKKIRALATTMVGASVAIENGPTPEEQAILDNGKLTASQKALIIQHEAYHTYRNDARASIAGTELVFRRLGDLLAKGDRAVGMVIDGSYELLEYTGFDGESLVSDAERTAIVALLEQERLDSVETEFNRFLS